MQLRTTLSVLLPAIAMVAAACAPATPAPAVPTLLDLPTAAPTAETVATLEPTAQPQASAPAPSLSFTPSVYQIPTEGIELDYPSDWTTVPVDVVGSRGSQGQLFSPGSSADTLAEGGSRMAVTVYQWDPKNNLIEFVGHRKTAWESSGFTIVKDEAGSLQDGRPYASFIIQTPDNHQAFFLFATLGEKYLEVSGEGNLALVAEIARTIRPMQ
jgi:hypothetical protein